MGDSAQLEILQLRQIQINISYPLSGGQALSFSSLPKLEGKTLARLCPF